jgi:hypothetical protein
LLRSTGIENLIAEVGGLGLVTAISQGVFKADATRTTDDASALGINKASAGILDSTFTFGITDSTITAKDLNSHTGRYLKQVLEQHPPEVVAV